MEFYREDFKSFEQLLRTLDTRPNSPHMRYDHASENEGSGFTLTESYEEAVHLLRYGYTDKIKDIKKGLLNNKKLTSQLYAKIPHPVASNQVVGFAPNVPNALLGLPKSMITIDRIPRKRKTLSLIYIMDGSCMVDAKVFVNAGVALVSAINVIEASGIQVKLQVAFGTAVNESGNEITFANVSIKDFNERFNLQKICFPLIHPSMFRRIGFKYIETSPFIQSHYSGYGRPLKRDVAMEYVTDKDTYILDVAWIENNDYSMEAIIKELGVCI